MQMPGLFFANSLNMNIVFSLFFTLLGVVHLIGFACAFGTNKMGRLRIDTRSLLGSFWLITSLLFFTSAFLYFTEDQNWWVVSLLAVLLSQPLIFTAWKDTKFFTLVNILILVVIFPKAAALSRSSNISQYSNFVSQALQSEYNPRKIVTELDVEKLPPPVARYLRYAGVVGKPQPNYFRVHFKGQIRSGPNSPWMSFNATQVSFLADLSRYFLMNASFFGIPIEAFHYYQGTESRMKVQAASLIPIIDRSGEEMFKAETVTLFNDLCLMAPAYLVSENIQWTMLDQNQVLASFKNKGIQINAKLYFSDDGPLTNFESDDRSQEGENGFQKVPWSTPIKEYKSFGSYRLFKSGEARWKLPEGEFAYIKLEIEDFEYDGSMN